jgi:uncharacterized protein (DUF1810 family)
VDFQVPFYRRVVEELRRPKGVELDVVRLPQIAGLGSGATAERFAVAEAAAYLEHTLLEARQGECNRLVMAAVDIRKARTWRPIRF